MGAGPNHRRRRCGACERYGEVSVPELPEGLAPFEVLTQGASAEMSERWLLVNQYDPGDRAVMGLAGGRGGDTGGIWRRRKGSSSCTASASTLAATACGGRATTGGAKRTVGPSSTRHGTARSAPVSRPSRSITTLWSTTTAAWRGSLGSLMTPRCRALRDRPQPTPYAFAHRKARRPSPSRCSKTTRATQAFRAATR